MNSYWGEIAVVSAEWVSVSTVGSRWGRSRATIVCCSYSFPNSHYYNDIPSQVNYISYSCDHSLSGAVPRI